MRATVNTVAAVCCCPILLDSDSLSVSYSENRAITLKRRNTMLRFTTMSAILHLEGTGWGAWRSERETDGIY